MSLPIDDFLEDIQAQLEQRSSLVIVAQPGAGKTTRVPLALLNCQWAQGGEILVLEPRRLAAIASAVRVASEMHNDALVGYQVRFENKTTAQTRLTFMTEAILARKLISDPELRNVKAVILDEFHERSLHTDLALGLLKELQELARPDLRLIVMSATLDAERVSSFLGNCPIVQVPGRVFPVDITYASRTPPLITDHNWVAEVAQLIRGQAASVQPGRHLLAFLPGRGEISRVQRELSSWAQQNKIQLFPVHGSLSLSEQREAIAPSPHSKILLATNIAETSLTIDGVDHVFDCGFAKTTTWEVGQAFPRLKLSRISRASAQQRTGRAGRQYPGKSFRHWTQLDERAMSAFDAPEIERSDLSETLLFLAQHGVRDFASFSWFETPPPAHIEQATQLLQNLGALEPDGTLTELGRKMAQLPLPPRLARLALEARPEHSGLAVTLCALLLERDITNSQFAFEAWRATFHSDLELRLELLRLSVENPRSLHGVDLNACKQVLRVRDQLMRTLKAKPLAPYTSHDIAKLLFPAFQDRLCRLRASHSLSARMVGRRGVALSKDHLLGSHDVFFALDGIEAKPDMRVSLTAPISKELISSLGQSELKTEIIFDEDKGLLQKQALQYHGLDIEEPRFTRATAEQAAPFLPQILIARWPRILQKREDVKYWFSRVQFLRKHLADQSWPDFSIEEIAEEICLGERDLNIVENKDLIVYFEQKLSFEQQQALREHAPARMTVPSGKSYAIEYPPEQSPFMAVRLQELFGLTANPKLAKGRIALVLHILGPNYRPVQVTADLANFWRVGYPEVRKELRARYPKHKWPEVPPGAE